MSRHRPHRRAVAVQVVVAVFAACFSARVDAGPVFTLVGQSRSVSTRAGAAGGDPVVDGREADGFRRFDDQSFSDFASDDYRVTATATTDSVLSPTMLSFSGVCRVTSEDLDPGDDAAGPVDAEAVAQGWVTFRLGVPHAIKFKTNVPFPIDTDPAEPGNDYRLLREAETGTAGDVVFDGRTRGRRSQVLPAGLYTFSYYHDATTFPGVPGDEQANAFTSTLQLAAVPLPESAWTGGAGMGLVALAWRARRRGT
jgi:hypothetical protein